jgi:hypothetical protein
VAQEPQGRKWDDSLQSMVPVVNVYHVWCDLNPGVKDTAFSEKAAAYLDHLKTDGLMGGPRIGRTFRLPRGPEQLSDSVVAALPRGTACHSYVPPATRAQHRNGRRERIRTSGPYVPNVVLYQAELLSDYSGPMPAGAPL